MTNLSMRQQNRQAQVRKVRDETSRKSREKALQLLKQRHQVRNVSSTCSLSIDTVVRIKKALTDKNNAYLGRLLNPASNRAGRKSVITPGEDALIKERMNFIASKGFAMDLPTIRIVMASIAADGRKRFKSGIPSAAVIRSFRARNRDITFRNSENKENAKLKGENFEHVQTYARALRQVEREIPGIFEDGDRFFNLDETAVDG